MQLNRQQHRKIEPMKQLPSSDCVAKVTFYLSLLTCGMFILVVIGLIL